MRARFENFRREGRSYIGENFVTRESRTVVKSPINDEEVGSFPNLQSEDVNLAYETAHKKVDIWRSVPYTEKVKIFETFTKLILQNVDELASLITLEVGKSLKDSKVEV